MPGPSGQHTHILFEEGATKTVGLAPVSRVTAASPGIAVRPWGCAKSGLVHRRPGLQSQQGRGGGLRSGSGFMDCIMLVISSLPFPSRLNGRSPGFEGWPAAHPSAFNDYLNSCARRV